jgi:hypothetical protein
MAAEKSFSHSTVTAPWFVTVSPATGGTVWERPQAVPTRITAAAIAVKVSKGELFTRILLAPAGSGARAVYHPLEIQYSGMRAAVPRALL